jgi:hypothetical protein
MKSCRRLFGLSAIAVVVASSFTACLEFKDGLLTPSTIPNWTQVYVRNSTRSEFMSDRDSSPIPVGATVWHSIHIHVTESTLGVFSATIPDSSSTRAQAVSVELL